MSDDKLVQLADAKMRIDDMVMRVGVSELEADWVAVCFALKDAELLRKKLHDREALAKVLYEHDTATIEARRVGQGFEPHSVELRKFDGCSPSTFDEYCAKADAIIRYATDTRPT